MRNLAKIQMSPKHVLPPLISSYITVSSLYPMAKALYCINKTFTSIKQNVLVLVFGYLVIIRYFFMNLFTNILTNLFAICICHLQI